MKEKVVHVSSPEQLRNAVLTGSKGDRISYIIGRSTKNHELMRREAWKLYAAGKVYLFQKRLTKPPSGVFRYIAECR